MLGTQLGDASLRTLSFSSKAEMRSDRLSHQLEGENSRATYPLERRATLIPFTTSPHTPTHTPTIPHTHTNIPTSPHTISPTHTVSVIRAITVAADTEMTSIIMLFSNDYGFNAESCACLLPRTRTKNDLVDCACANKQWSPPERTSTLGFLASLEIHHGSLKTTF